MENFHLKYPIIVNFLNFLFCCVSVSSVKHFHKYLDIQNWDVRKVSFMCVSILLKCWQVLESKKFSVR